MEWRNFYVHNDILERADLWSAPNAKIALCMAAMDDRGTLDSIPEHEDVYPFIEAVMAEVVTTATHYLLFPFSIAIEEAGE